MAPRKRVTQAREPDAKQEEDASPAANVKEEPADEQVDDKGGKLTSDQPPHDTTDAPSKEKAKPKEEAQQKITRGDVIALSIFVALIVGADSLIIFAAPGVCVCAAYWSLA